VGLLLLPLVAHAEPPAIDAQAFKPSPFFEDLFTVGKAEVPSPYLWNFGLMANYQNDPLVLRMDGKQVRSVLTHQLTGDLLVAGRLGDWFAFGAALPVILYQSGEGLPGGSEPRPVGIGDLRIYPRLHLLRLLADRFALAFTPILSLPTGQLVDPFMGRPNATLLPELEASFDLGGAGVAFDLGWLITENQTALNLDLVDELKFKLGGWFDLTERFTLIGEVAGATPITAPLAEITEAPLEFLGGGRYRLLPGLDLRFGAGAGTTTGYASPDFRLFAGLQRGRPLPTAPPPPVGDRDGDGLVDAVDRCPDDPEDRDDFQDEDGCPDPDNDGDGVLDPWVANQGLLARYAQLGRGQDACPDVPEDRDGFKDEDGCPDPDDDDDGVLDPWVTAQGQLARYRTLGQGSDRCPRVPEDRDGFQDEDGCPDPDNDKDGICDPWVATRPEAERTSITCKGSDECPLEPETVNGIEDEDGCPDKLVKIEGKKILILQKVLFYYNKTQIKPESFPLLDEVTRTILDNPQLSKIEVAGHTDTRGHADLNRRLADGRARAVRDYLVQHGVAPARLISRGYGEDRPLVRPEQSEEDYQTNRRVEFTILEQN